MDDISYEDIRPFKDEEISKILPRLVKSEELQPFLNQFVRPVFGDQFFDVVDEVDSLYSFQQKVIYPFLQHILNQSADDVSFSGLDDLKNEESHLFMSNHRDIVLDSALINKGLFEFGHNTVEIAIGDNLVREPWIKKLVRMNKSFLVKRGLQPSEMMAASKQLSSYIRNTIVQRNQSVWIAQREGRAKDGDDQTSPGLLKMLNLSSSEDIRASFSKLTITPVAVSYEIDPCDSLKIPELMAIANGKAYRKEPGEDERSMKTGIFGQKGNIHVAFGMPINHVLKNVGNDVNRKQLITLVTEEIDRQIHLLYKIWPTNYLAYDMLHQGSDFKDRYTDDTKHRLQERIRATAGMLHKNESEILPHFLGMYAKPLENKLSREKVTTSE